jgi:RNA polymerase sigma-70 factor (ECF subfamily)
MIEDRLLIYKFKRDSGDALRRIYEKYRDYLLKMAVVLAGDVDVAEDVVEDVFVSFAGSAERIKAIGSLKHYLATSVANRVRNLWRDGQRHPTVAIEEAGDMVSQSKSPQGWAILSEELQRLRKAMAEIPYEQREVIVLYMQGDITFRQIAGYQDVSVNTVQGRYRYGIEKLRSILNSEGKE